MSEVLTDVKTVAAGYTKAAQEEHSTESPGSSSIGSKESVSMGQTGSTFIQSNGSHSIDHLHPILSEQLDEFLHDQQAPALWYDLVLAL